MRSEHLRVLNSLGGEASTQNSATRSDLVGGITAAQAWFLLSFLLSHVTSALLVLSDHR